MMNRYVISLLLIMCIILCACGNSGVPAYETVLPAMRAVEPFDTDSTEKMANVICENRALIHEGRLYTFDFDNEYRPILAVYRLTETGPEDFSVLTRDCAPKSIGIYDQRLYYINSDRGDAVESINLDGSDRQLIKEGPCAWLQIFDGELYYCDAEWNFCRAGLDGSGETKLIGQCFYPYIFDGLIIYQSGGDGEKLHALWLEDGEDYTLTERSAYAPIVIDGKLYYTGQDGFYSFGLNSMEEEQYSLPELYGPVEIYSTSNGYELRGVSNDNGIYQWKTALGEANTENMSYIGYRICDYLGEGYRVDTHYYTDRRIRNFVLIGPDGTETEYISGTS